MNIHRATRHFEWWEVENYRGGAAELLLLISRLLDEAFEVGHGPLTYECRPVHSVLGDVYAMTATVTP